MRRPAWFRVLTALWGIWFTTALVEPAGVLACPMHSGHAGVSGTAAQVHAHGASVAHAGGEPTQEMSAAVHGGSAHADIAHADIAHGDALRADVTLGDPSDDADGPAKHQCCTCIGQCCAMSPTLLPSSPTAIASIVASVTESGVPSPHSPLVSRVEHVLPFANGPPRHA